MSTDVNLKNMAAVTGGMTAIYLLYRYFQDDNKDKEHKPPSPETETETETETENKDDVISDKRQKPPEENSGFFSSRFPFLSEITHTDIAYDGFKIKNLVKILVKIKRS